MNASKRTEPMTPFSRILMTAAVKGEALFARVFARNRVARHIIAYDGYATEEHLIVLGRVQSSLREHVPHESHGRLRNFRDMLSLFLTTEVAHAGLIVNGSAAETDDEGYFIEAVSRNGRSGIVNVKAVLPGRPEIQICPVFAPAPVGPAMVICDIDDTVLRTGAYSLVRNLWNSLTGSALTRHVFPDAVALLQALQAAGHDVYFVSSSPWNLFGFLRAIFQRSGVPRGPMFLRDLGLGEGKFITDGHGSHKGRAIDTILAANPQRQAILIGDTGQQDAEIYCAAINRHKGRIRNVMLRVPPNGLDLQDHADLTALGAKDVPLFHGSSFDEVFHDPQFSYLERTAK